MKKIFAKIKEFLTDIFFPRFCLGCGKEGAWLCQDCLSILEIRDIASCSVCLRRVIDFKVCPSCKNKTGLAGLFWALSYEKPLVKKIIHQYKYEPLIRELAQPLANIIISHLLLVEADKNNFLNDFVLVPLPLHAKRKKWRGFDQAQELSKEIGNYFDIPVLDNILTRQKETPPQAELGKEEREKNIKDAFLCKNKNLITGKKIFLVDDVYTTGATMQEATKILKSAGAKEIWGLVIARG